MLTNESLFDYVFAFLWWPGAWDQTWWLPRLPLNSYKVISWCAGWPGAQEEQKHVFSDLAGLGFTNRKWRLSVPPARLCTTTWTSWGWRSGYRRHIFISHRAGLCNEHVSESTRNTEMQQVCILISALCISLVCLCVLLHMCLISAVSSTVHPQPEFERIQICSDTDLCCKRDQQKPWNAA